ncbi:MAG: EAL domain-containing protein, partial [Mesorhizobium sp.]|nr:EAL domain-containing protein [Mesorhizobium sp.]
MRDRQQVDLLIDFQSEILEMVACGEPAATVADRLCRRVEAIAEGAICSVLTVDREGLIHPLAGPSLPAHYSHALDCAAIGESVGSCGTAAYRGEAVEVVDIENDPLWNDFKALALPVGLRACWSSPIKARDGRVIGTFAFYFRTCRGPNATERALVARCTHLCAIAIEQHDIRNRVHGMAYLDALSGLPNRASFNLRIRQVTAPGQPPFALLQIDLDYLKMINDTLGHASGDALIRGVATRLKAVRETMEAFRLGGDEFAVIVAGCDSEETMTQAARMLIAKISEPLQHEGHMITPDVTVGGVLHDGEGVDADTLCQNADFALYHGKETKRGGFVPFREGMRTAISQRMTVIANVGQALTEGRMLAHYQPIVRIDSGEIVGLEALARMRTVDGRIVAAGDFHEAMGDPRVAYNLTGSMLRKVAADTRAWLDMGIDFQHVGFNVAGADFQRGDLESRIAEAFAEAGVPLRHIILEVNETVFMGGHDNQVARQVERLRDKGMLVALDDFGTGHASLTHLLDFPVDIIKIDKTFVDRVVHDRQSIVIVEALIDVARKLGMKIVAEGIESAEQAERLVELGCVLGQGYRFAPPGSAAITAELLRCFSQRPRNASVHSVP